MVEDNTFHIKTDYKPIIGAMQRTTDRDIFRKMRLLNYISIYTTDQRHLTGADNTAAGALSWTDEDQSAEDAGDTEHMSCFTIFYESEAETLQLEPKRDSKLQDISADKTTTRPPSKSRPRLLSHPQGISRPIIPNSLAGPTSNNSLTPGLYFGVQPVWHTLQPWLAICKVTILVINNKLLWMPLNFLSPSILVRRTNLTCIHSSPTACSRPFSSGFTDFNI